MMAEFSILSRFRSVAGLNLAGNVNVGVERGDEDSDFANDGSDQNSPSPEPGMPAATGL